MEKKNSFHANSKYFTISTYTILTVSIIAIILRAIFFWESTSNFISNLLGTLSPFFFGCLIALLINPLVNWFQFIVFGKWCRIKNKGVCKLLAITTSYIVILAAIIAMLLFVIPEIVDSLSLLLQQLPLWAGNIIEWVSNLPIFEDSNNTYLNAIQKAISSVDSVLREYLSSFITGLTTTVVLTGVSIVKFIYNLIVAIIVSCYLLVDKKMLIRSTKRIFYALLKKETADTIVKDAKTAVAVFTGFFDGKMIDSLIIGVLCFIAMVIISFFNVPGFSECALLISLLVGVTNMIPYFGPFLGAIPSALILLIYSPNSAFIFVVWIIILQQLDGNVIGPKILGDSTGLRPLWIIFAISVGGWLGGVLGMFLGVPCVAVITKLIDQRIDKKLASKNIDMPMVVNDKIYQPKKKKKKSASKNK